MKITTSVENIQMACGSWPANIIADVQSVRVMMGKKGFVGTPLFLVAKPGAMRAFSCKIPNSERSYGEFLMANKLIDDVYVIRFDEIDLKEDSVLFYTYSVGFPNYPEIDVGFYAVEITDIGPS